MNKRMKKKKETQLKEWAIKEGLFFFNKKVLFLILMMLKYITPLTFCQPGQKYYFLIILKIG
jgi:hypothetical protein